MITLIKKLFGLNKELNVLSIPRSPKWSSLRKKHLIKNPYCCACGGNQKVIPHHIVPVHVDPSLELDPNNLITLCEEKNFNCHLFFGHLRNWRFHNKNVIEDSNNWFEKIKKTKGI